MKLISREELEKHPWRGRGNSSKVFREILSLEKGQILFIEPNDWGPRKYPPTQVVKYIEKNYPRKYNTLRHAAGKGWAVERMA